jgi:hypothetical protein
MDSGLEAAAISAARLPSMRSTMTEAIAATPSGKAAGLALVMVAAASLALLINHPSSSAQTFAEVLREEAANRTRDAVVHGGFIAILGVQLVCLAVLSLRLGLERVAAVGGFVLSAIGAILLILSMLLDGFVVPAVAMRYVDILERQGDANILFVLLGTLIGFLMPTALLFQSAGMACWSAALVRRQGVARGIGLFGVAIAVLTVIGIVATAGRVPHVLIGAVALLAAWYGVVGLALTLRRL